MSRKENIPYGLNYLFVIKERSDWGGGGVRKALRGVNYTIDSPSKVLVQCLRIWGVELHLKLILPGQTYKVKLIE